MFALVSPGEDRYRNLHCNMRITLPSTPFSVHYSLLHSYQKLCNKQATRQIKSVRCNIEARWRNHHCRVCLQPYNIFIWAYPAVPYFYTLSHKRQDRFSEKRCVLILSTTLSQTFLILRRIQRDAIINVQYKVVHLKCPLFVSDLKEN